MEKSTGQFMPNCLRKFCYPLSHYGFYQSKFFFICPPYRIKLHQTSPKTFFATWAAITLWTVISHGSKVHFENYFSCTRITRNICISWNWYTIGTGIGGRQFDGNITVIGMGNSTKAVQILEGHQKLFGAVSLRRGGGQLEVLSKSQYGREFHRLCGQSVSVYQVQSRWPASEKTQRIGLD